jgi:hypothetical protein
MPEANETKQFECDQDRPFFSWGNCGVLSIIVSSRLYVQVRINHLSLGFG